MTAGRFLLLIIDNPHRQEADLATASANGRKTIFITGAASGIGLATAKRFAKEGWFVGLADIDATGLTLAQGEIGAANYSTGQPGRPKSRPAVQSFVA